MATTILGMRHSRYLDEEQVVRRKRMLAWTGVVVAVIALGSYPAYRLVLREIYRNRAKLAEQARVDGFSALEKGDWRKAVERLQFCLRYRPSDAEAFKQLAVAYGKAPEAEAFWERLKAMRRYAELKPDDLDASRDLLAVYTEVGMTTESLALSARLLEKNSQDFAAIHARVQAFKALRRWGDALQAAQARNRLQPNDLLGRLEVLYLKGQLGIAPSDIVREAREALDKQPDDSGRQLLLSVSLQVAGDIPEARKWAVAATSRPSTRPSDLSLLVRHLDSLGLFEETLSLVKGISELRGNSEVQALVLRRLWEAQDLKRMIEMSDDLSPATGTPASLFLRAVALLGSGQPAKATEIADALLKRTDSAARTLGTVMSMLLQPNFEPLKMARAVETAIAADPRNAVLQDLLGSAYARLGEREMAIEAFGVAAALAPAWSHPLQMKAQVLLEAGYTNEATRAAISALARQKTSPEALSILVRAWAAQAQRQQLALPGETLTMLRDMSDRMGDRERIFPAYLASLAAAGDSPKAQAELDRYLSTTRPKAGDELLLLANLSASHKLGREAAIVTAYRDSYGITPSLALTSALLARADGDAARSIATFNELRSKGTDPKADWDLPYAQLLESLGSADAPKAWKDLLARHPDDIGLVKMVLGLPSLVQDKPFMTGVIKQLRKLTGEDAVAWRLAEARLTLAWNPDDKTASDVMLSLTGILKQNARMIEARVLLAQYLERGGDAQGAIEQLRLAIGERSDLSALRLTVAKLLVRRSKIEEARDELRALLATRDADAVSKRSAAVALGELGDWQGGAAALEAIVKAQRNAVGDADLARMLLRAGRAAEALQMARELAKSNEPASIEVLADTLLATGNLEEARSVLDRLDKGTVADPLRSLSKAGLLLRYGDMQGMAVLESACKQFPQDRRTWEALIAWTLRTAGAKASRTVCERALGFLPGDAGLQRYNDSMGMVAKLEADRPYRELAALLLQPGGKSDSAYAILEQVSSVLSGRTPVREGLARLRELFARADDAVTTLAVARAHQQFEDYRSVEQILVQGRQKYPLDGSLAQAHARLLLLLKRYPEAIAAADEWRRNDMARINPDIVRCRAYLGLGQARQALDALSPYWRDGAPLPNPAQAFDLAEATAQTLAALGRWDEVYSWLAPQLATSPRALGTWAAVAGNPRTPAIQARKMLVEAASKVPAGSLEANRTVLAQWLALYTRTGLDADLQAAGLLYDRLLKVSPDDAGFLLLAAEYHRATGQPDQARADVERILKADPRNWVAMNNMAYLLALGNRDLDRARQLIETVAAANPFQPNMQDTLAMVYRKLSRWQEAADILDGLIKTDPERPAWRLRRAYCLAKLDKLVDAKREWALVPPDFGDLPSTSAEDKALVLQLRKQLR